MGKSGERGPEGEPGIKVPVYIRLIMLPDKMTLLNIIIDEDNRSVWHVLLNKLFFGQGRTGHPGVPGAKGLKVGHATYIILYLHLTPNPES